LTTATSLLFWRFQTSDVLKAALSQTHSGGILQSNVSSSSPVAILAILIALPITSEGRFSPLAALGIRDGALYDINGGNGRNFSVLHGKLYRVNQWPTAMVIGNYIAMPSNSIEQAVARIPSYYYPIANIFKCLTSAHPYNLSH
jgi:hypothetical protein